MKCRVAQIGLGAMGRPMAQNLINAGGYEMYVYDQNEETTKDLVLDGCIVCQNPEDAVKTADVLLTMLPNDEILLRVTRQLIPHLPLDAIHISCSTVTPQTSRMLAAEHTLVGQKFVGAPIFARADGVAKKQASFVVGGVQEYFDKVRPILEANSNGIFWFGPDPGAGNIVKLCGNFMIASAIETCAEALSLAEKAGLDRGEVMSMLNHTIFDCLIYRGYGDRVAHKQHIPGDPLVGPGFQLDLGLKDVTLALNQGKDLKVSMPVAEVLRERFLTASARGLGKRDWSAISMCVSSESGLPTPEWPPPKRQRLDP